MNETLHKNHFAHLTDLQSKIKISGEMLKSDLLKDNQRETLSQNKAIAEMQFEDGMKGFARP